jgi:putative phage-type endonuclease
MAYRNCDLILSVREAEKNHDKWLKTRTMGIGGSDAGTIVGDNPWKSPYALWLEKTGQLVPEDISGTDPVYWGTTLEDIVAREFTKRTGKRVRRCGTMQSNDVPWMLANVDRLIIGEKAGLECKTTNAFNIKAWQDDGLPNAYYWQCQHYMMVTGLPTWYIAVLIGGQHYDYKCIPRNDDDIDYLAQKEEEFWNMVQTMTPPPIDGSRSTTEAIQSQYPGGQTEPVELPQEAADALALIDSAKAERKRLDDVIMTNENIIKCLMGDDEIAAIGDRKVTWKNQKGRITVDTKKLKKEFPDVYEACMKQGKPTRRFLV